MKKGLMFVLVVVCSLALTVSVVKAAGISADWLRVGTQASGGVTYFNGTIINNTTGTGGVDKPVTFGDNVRIDGRVFRGAVAGTADTQPFIVNDNMEVVGSLTTTGGIVYDHTVSGLSATTIKGAIDELGVSLKNLINGSELSAAGGTQKVAALPTTTWTGSAYYASTLPLQNGLTAQTSTITVTFQPTSDTTGTFTSSPLYVFNPKGSSFEHVGHVGSNYCGNSASGITYPEGTYQGNYQIVNDFLVWTTPTSSTNANCQPITGFSYTSDFSTIAKHGESMYLSNPNLGEQVILTRQ
jgi:hypothetical protein